MRNVPDVCTDRTAQRARGRLPAALLLLSLSAILPLFASGDDGSPDMPPRFRADPAAVVAAAASATAERFPDADAVTLDERFHVALAPDGTEVVWDDEWIKVLTEKGRRAHSAIAVDYSARYGGANVLCVEIVGTNGQVRAVDFGKTLKTATDNSSMGANIVDPMDKTLRCAVPGLAVGEIRHVRTRRHTFKTRMKGAWAEAFALEYFQPIVSTVVTVDHPADLPVVHAVVRNPFGRTCVRASDEKSPNGRTLMKWTVRDVPQAFSEPGMPHLLSCVQSLHLSTVRDWKDVSRWYWSVCERHLAKTTPAMTNKVAKLVKGRATPDEKMRAVFKFVSQEIRYMGLTLEGVSPGYEPHDVDVTFANRYGVCRDKAALLVAMLRIAGFEAYPVMIHTKRKKDAQVPSPYFNHAIAAVADASAPGGYRLMDPTDESTRDLLPGYLCDKSFLVAHPVGETLRTSPVVDFRKNMFSVDTSGTFAPDGSLLLETSFAFDGLCDTILRDAMLSDRPSKRRRFFDGIWSSAASGAEMLSCKIEPENLRDIERPLRARTVVRVPDAILRGRTRDSISLPFITRHFSLVGVMLDENTALEDRRFPLCMPSTAGAQETVRLTMGDATGRAVHLPEKCEIGTNGYSFALNAVCTSGVLTVSRRIAVDAMEFDVPTYHALRYLCKDTETADRAEAQFEALDEEEDASYNVLRSESYVHFTSPRSWVETNVVEKKILGRNGLKSASELKIRYAPSTRSVELVSATVSNRSGRVRSVTPKEVNVMDCGWAASAPRYPASKILVANLPAVEIGSVIRTVVATTVTNSPTAYTAIACKGGIEPYGFERYEYHVPDGMPFKWWENRLGHEGTNGVYRWEWSDPERIPNEPLKLRVDKWLPTFKVSAADWRTQHGGLVDALARARRLGSAEARRKGAELTAACATPQERITAIRKFMSTHMRMAGPDVFELPFDSAFTPPDTSMSDAYASRADCRNLLFSLLEGAGFDCSFVLSTSDRFGYQESDDEYRGVPLPDAFDALVIRAVWTDGWLPFFRDRQVFWVAGENEYTPVEASAWLGDSFYDPVADEFGTIGKGVDDVWRAKKSATVRMEVRENCGVDFDVSISTYGSAVGPMRKRDAERLPEKRSRMYQQMLGHLSQNATATSELHVDSKSYPFVMSFSAYADDYAQKAGDTLTVRLPTFSTELFSIGVAPRNSPLALPGENPEEEKYEVLFPKGWTEIEHLPEPCVLINPTNVDDVWLLHRVKSRVEDGRLVVTVSRTTQRPRMTILPADYFAFLEDWNRRASSTAGRTIVVRRPHPSK